jgi:hypothetical protein
MAAGRQGGRSGLRAGVAAALLSLTPPAAFASIEAGDYRGRFTHREQPVPALLSLVPVRQVGDSGGRLRFAGAWACGFDLVYAGATGQLSNYNLTGAGSGNCRPLARGSMRVHPTGRGVQIEIFAADGKMARKVVLVRAAK